jgi:carotenoid cleavage dioxygenase-like enzyme
MRRYLINDHAPWIEHAFSLNLCEQSDTVEAIEGDIPAFIREMDYLNGAVRFSGAGLRYRHWLDGDGIVCALRFERQGVCFTYRFARCHKFGAEEQPTSISIGQGYCLQLINCLETDNRLTIDVLEYERPIYDQYQVVPDLFSNVVEGEPVRFVVDMKSRGLIVRWAIDYRLAPDFPSIEPRRVTQPYRDVWMLGISATGRRKFFDQLVYADWAKATAYDIYQAPTMHYLSGEPIFIGDPSNQRTGAILCQILDAEHMIRAFAIFDAFHVSSGPVTMLRLWEPIHLLFHASFHRE